MSTTRQTPTIGRVIREQADCVHCPAPLEKRFGRWVHHWIYKHACATPEAKVGTITQDGQVVG